MVDHLSDEALNEIERRLDAGTQAAAEPWTPFLETTDAIGGSSFIRLGKEEEDREIYLEVHLGGDRLTSPDPRLDAIVELVGNAPASLRELLAEVRRLR